MRKIKSEKPKGAYLFKKHFNSVLELTELHNWMGLLSTDPGTKKVKGHSATIWKDCTISS